MDSLGAIQSMLGGIGDELTSLRTLDRMADHLRDIRFDM